MKLTTTAQDRTLLDVGFIDEAVTASPAVQRAVTRIRSTLGLSECNPMRRRAQLLAMYALGVITGRQFMRYYYSYQ